MSRDLVQKVTEKYWAHRKKDLAHHCPDVRSLGGGPAGPGARPLLVALLVEEAAAVVDPVVVVAAAELDGELAHGVGGSLHVDRDLGRVDDPGRPPAVVAQLHPHNLVVQRHPTRLAAMNRKCKD